MAMADDEKVEEGTEKPAEEPKPDPVDSLKKENETLKASMDALRRDNETSKAYIQQIIAGLQNQRNDSNGDADEQAKTLKELFEEDPVAAADHLVNLKVQPLQENYLSNQATLNRQMTADKMSRDDNYKDYWKKYESEVDEFMSRIPLNIRAQPASYENAFKFVMINHLPEIQADARSNDVEKQKRAFVEGGGAGNVSGRRPAELSAEEKRVAEGLKMSPEEYIKWRDI